MKSQVRSVIVKAAGLILLSSFNPGALWSQASAAVDSHPGNTQQTSDWPTTKRGKHISVRLNPDANMALYNTIVVGTVAYTGPANKLKAQESAKLESLLHDSLSKDFAAVRLSADPSATRMLTANVNITSVKRTHPWINILTTAAVFVPLDFGKADATARIVDQQTGQVIAEIESEGCGQIYEVLPSFWPLGQSKLALKKAGRSVAKEVARMNAGKQPLNTAAGDGNATTEVAAKR